jgi:hypothetical protein
MTRIVTRQAIALQAARAAQLHAQAPAGTPLPQNPYCAHMEPEHHAEFAASLERAMAPEECEATA